MGAVLNVNYGEGKRGAVSHPCHMLHCERVGYDAKAAATAAS